MNTSSAKLMKLYMTKKMKPKVTESLLIAAQNITIRINYLNAKTENTQENSKCRL